MEMPRKKLTQIIEADEGRNWWVPEVFENKVRSQLPTELEIISPPPIEEGNYNCFVFALGLENDREFLGGNNPIQKEFIRHLLSREILKVREDSIPGTLVFYEDDSTTITHGGIMSTPEEVISKWMWGPIIRHKLWDVPSSFGDKIFYCDSISPQTAKEEYMRYKDSGVEIKPIT